MSQPAAYHGPYLTWAGKADPAAQPDITPGRPSASESEFAAWPAPAPGAPRLHPAATTPAAYVAPPRPRPTAVAAYVAPPAPPARQSRPAQVAASAPQAAAAAQPPAQVLAQNDTPAAPAQANPATSTGVHYYSLHREYGLTPDQVATPKDRPMVLIGPPDDPTSPKQDDADDNGRSAQHGGAEGADE